MPGRDPRTPEEIERDWLRRRRKRWTRRSVVIGSVVLGALLLISVPVIRISTAIPGTNPGAVERAHELVDRFQPDGADPLGGNAHEMLVRITERVSAIHDERSSMFVEAVEQDSSLDESWSSYYGYLDPHSFPSGVEIDEGDDDFPPDQHEAFNTLHHEHMIRLLEAITQDEELQGWLDELAITLYARREQPRGPAMQMLLPELGTTRRLARINGAIMRWARMEHDDARVVRAFEHSLALARVLAHQLTLIDRLVAESVVAMTLRPVTEFAVSGSCDAETMRGMSRAIERQLPLPSIELALLGERFMLVDYVERTHSAGAGYLLPEEIERWGVGRGASPTIRNVPGLFEPRKDETLALIDEITDLVVSAARTRWVERDSDVFDAIEQRSFGNPILEHLVPAYAKAVRTIDAGQAQLDGARLVLAVETYRLDHGGELPDALEALVPSYVAELPEDAYAPDGRYRYRILDEPDQHLRAYLVYTVGRDGEDNEGAEHPDDTEAGLRGSTLLIEGHDFVFNRPRESD